MFTPSTCILCIARHGYAQNFAHILNFYLLAMLFTASIMLVLCSTLLLKITKHFSYECSIRVFSINIDCCIRLFINVFHPIIGWYNMPAYYTYYYGGSPNYGGVRIKI